MPEEPQTTATPHPMEPKRYLEPPPDHPANEYTREAVPGVADAVKSIKLDDFKKVHTQPCFRDAYLWGMSGGFAAGGLKFIVGGMDMDSFRATAGKVLNRLQAEYQKHVIGQWELAWEPVSSNMSTASTGGDKRNNS